VEAHRERLFDRVARVARRHRVPILLVATGLRGVAIPAIETNLSTMIETAQRRSIRVLLCGMETLPTHGWDYALAFHNVFPRVASRYAVPLVPFLLAGVALTPDMSSDGIHPNAAGAQRIGDTIWPHVEPLLQASAPSVVRQLMAAERSAESLALH